MHGTELAGSAMGPEAGWIVARCFIYWIASTGDSAFRFDPREFSSFLVNLPEFSPKCSEAAGGVRGGFVHIEDVRSAA